MTLKRLATAVRRTRRPVRRGRAAPREQVGYARERRHVARVHPRRPAPGGAPAPVRPDGTYLITGGTGGLGLEAARTLHAAGARHLVLVGRGAPGAETARGITRLRDAGACVRTFTADAADLESMTAAFDAVGREAELPPLAAVLHLAGALDDGALLLQTRDRVRRAMAAKAVGAWNLHLLTRDTDLDALVLYSSASALLGTPGQAGYAAGNAFLDGLASYRNALGAPTAAVQWGSWAGTGMSHRAGLDEDLERSGEGTIPVEEGGAALLGLLAERPFADPVAVLPTDWRRLADHAADTLPSLLPLLPDRPPAGAAARPADFRAALDAARGEERRALLVREVRRQVGTVLGRAEEVDGDGDLFANGLDSLTAIRLRHGLQQAARVGLPQAVVFEHPTIDALAGHLLRAVDGDGGAEEDGEEGSAC
ncbi:beta-ketoacyl reductase [Nocardiopsis suaedae]|uniref:Beta-ketoacyl reductase n=1 Tax=Nocardiopsis suaedae TaxID=3018444 RepID=A0ABT4TNM0_9ACTN|nr:beta-ketoacyl reductase [Nocardiopsis suaedae]MDA2806289.1 beta-ketoacyl reductase [Nocardiopsis suaedae]